MAEKEVIVGAMSFLHNFLYNPVALSQEIDYIRVVVLHARADDKTRRHTVDPDPTVWTPLDRQRFGHVDDASSISALLKKGSISSSSFTTIIHL